MFENNNENNNETATTDSSIGAQFVKTQDEMNRALAENATLRAENEKLSTDYARLLNDYGQKASEIVTVRKFIQDSIDRDEWTESELEEIFWEELAELLNLDLKQTEEKEITITVTYTATVTVPKGTDLDELELEVESYPEVQLHGTDVGEARRDNLEVSEY